MAAMACIHSFVIAFWKETTLFFVIMIVTIVIFLQAKSTREPMDLEAMFEQKLSELQRGNTADSLKTHEKYVELEEHIQNVIQAAEG